MTYNLETSPAPRKRCAAFAIDPVSRVEGQGKVTILLDDQNKVCTQVRLHIVEFRVFREIHPGPAAYWKSRDGPAPVRHLPGVAPPAASKALDVIVGARKLTRLPRSCAG
jgi:NAD-reducing hydrogenase large subunit